MAAGRPVGVASCAMASADRYKPYAPDVRAVVRLEEALPPEHPVHLFVDLVRSVDLAHFATPPGPKGEKPYHPHALFGLLAWGYLHGVRSARKLARREARLAKIRAARERLEAEQRAEQGLPEDAALEIADKEQRSFADPDARIMLMKRGEYDYAYNAQAAVDAESGIIVAAALTNVAPDVGHLPDLVAQVRSRRDA